MNQNTFTLQEKNKWLKIGIEHQKSDRFIQGNWIKEKGEDGIFRGCFFGCYMQTDDNVLSTAAKEMNIPEWLVRVAEKIFEGLPKEEAILFPVKLIEAIPVNSNLEQVWKNWNYSILMDKNNGQITFVKGDKDVEKAIIKVANLFKLDFISAESAWSAAWSAAESAWSAAEDRKSVV